ncbi:MAG: rhodanese-like domain-containing protein [Ferruginibacter sp.]
MKKIQLLFCLIAGSLGATAQTSAEIAIKSQRPSAMVDFDAYEKLSKEVKAYRKDRLVSLETFLQYAKDKNTIILDTRSAEMYKRKHIKGAINLNFSDFAQDRLRQVIGAGNKRILIYCNNNFAPDFDPVSFVSKSALPVPKLKFKTKSLTLALNIPTFINLYGYGYRNIYELADLISFPEAFVAFEGTDVLKPATEQAVKITSGK